MELRLFIAQTQKPSPSILKLVI